MRPQRKGTRSAAKSPKLHHRQNSTKSKNPTKVKKTQKRSNHTTTRPSFSPLSVQSNFTQHSPQQSHPWTISQSKFHTQSQSHPTLKSILTTPITQTPTLVTFAHHNIHTSLTTFSSTSSSAFRHRQSMHFKMSVNQFQQEKFPMLKLRKLFFSTGTTSSTEETQESTTSQPSEHARSTTTIESTQTAETITPAISTDPSLDANEANDAVKGSIPRPRGMTDENQYKLGSSGWKKPAADQFKDLTEEQRQEIKERFTLENSRRINGALNKLRSTRGTMAYGAAQGSDSIDGSMPQRNGSMSHDSLGAFDRAEQYRRKMEQRKKMDAETLRRQKMLEEQKKEFEFDPRKALEIDMGEFSRQADNLFKRETSPEEAEKLRAEKIMGKNWMAKWF